MGDGLRRSYGLETIPLVGAKKEKLVFNNRSAERAAELVELQLRSSELLLTNKIFVSVKIVVPEVLPHAAMNIISSGFCNQVIYRSGAVSILRGEI